MGNGRVPELRCGHSRLHGGDSLGAGHAGRGGQRTGAHAAGLSVIPPLLGWFALSLPINFAIPVFFFAFGTLYFADIWAVKQGLAPAWYTALRRPVSLVIISSMIVAWGATLVLSY